MTKLFIPPLVSAFGSTGTAVAGGSWNFYKASTLTAASVYADAGLAASLGSSIATDAAGRAPTAYLDPAILYRAILKDSGGTTIRDIDPYVSDSVQGLVAVTDYGAKGDGSTDDTAAIATAYGAAANAHKDVLFPPCTASYLISDAITIPAGVNSFIDAEIVSVVVGESAPGKLSMADSAMHFLGAGKLRDVQLILTGGSPRVYDFRYTGQYQGEALLIVTGVFVGIHIDGLDIRDAKYGILRQGGATTSIDGCLIVNGVFKDLLADAIEFNVCPGDRNILISNHLIDTIDAGSQSGRDNWGIGIGMAGSTYDDSWPDDSSVKTFTIRNIQGRSLRQLIHVEDGRGFDISEIYGEDISTAYSTGPVPPVCATIACYGCKDFSIDNVSNRRSSDEAHVLAVAGWTLAEGFLSPCSNFSISNVRLENGCVSVDAGLSRNDSGGELYSSGRISDVHLQNGGMSVVGRTEDLLLENIFARRARAAGPALFLCTQGIGDGRDAFRSTISRLRVANVSAADQFGADSAQIAVLGQTSVAAHDNNFAVPARFPQVNRTFWSDGGGGLGYGFEFVAGDLHIDTSNGSRRLVTVGGSRNRSGDTFGVADSHTIYATADAPVGNWTDPGHHEVGQRITLSFSGGGSLQTTVVRTYIDGGSSTYRMTISDPITSGTTGTIGATNAPTTVSV